MTKEYEIINEDFLRKVGRELYNKLTPAQKIYTIKHNYCLDKYDMMIPF